MLTLTVYYRTPSLNVTKRQHWAAMILPDDERCIEILEALQDEPNLTPWESDFIESNLDRTSFSPKQRDVFGQLEDKYDV